jgi:hypothetical protein
MSKVLAKIKRDGGNMLVDYKMITIHQVGLTLMDIGDIENG